MDYKIEEIRKNIFKPLVMTPGDELEDGAKEGIRNELSRDRVRNKKM